MKLGMIGLPFSGKTTVFNALTGAHGATGAYTHGHANIASVSVPDERLDILADIFEPKKTVHATMDFVDTPGIGAKVDRSQAAQYLATLREVDALAHVIRCFESDAAPHPLGSIDPQRDARELRDELVIADLDIVEKRVAKLHTAVTKPSPEAEQQQKELEVLERCLQALQDGTPLSSIKLAEADREIIHHFGFLTRKPMLDVLNVAEGDIGEEETEVRSRYGGIGPNAIAMCGELEMEIAELQPEERGEFLEGMGVGEPASSRLIRACYTVLGLRSFFTYVSNELHAWTVHAGDTAHEAAGKIHTDMERGFIRAEVVAFDDLRQAGSVKDAKTAGRLRLEGKEYEVQDGDVITFRFKV